MAFNNSVTNSQEKNVPIQSEVIVPKDELVHTYTRISKKKIEELAIQKNGTCGKGIGFSDVMEFRCSKSRA
jgi:hypothetical protein